MITKSTKKFLENYHGTNWELRVRRPGFLQSQFLASEALMKPLPIGKGLKLQYENMIWVNEAALYDGGKTKSFDGIFDKAFFQNLHWPKRIIDILEDCEMKTSVWMKKTAQLIPHSSLAQRRQLFKEYFLLHKYIHWCYVAAVPLTNYCEKRLRETNPELLTNARPWKKLDVDKLGDSLKKIKNSSSAKKPALISKHLHTYAWIKTAYNIVGAYTEQDVLEELKQIKNHTKPSVITSRSSRNCEQSGLCLTAKQTRNSAGLFRSSDSLAISGNCFLNGLEIGMYARNRMKELSQYIWFAVEPLGRQLADDLHITRDDFFRLLPSEVLAFLKHGRLSLTQDALDERKHDYMVGYLRGQPVLITGAAAKKLSRELQAIDTPGVTQVQGTVACKGKAKGKVKIVMNQPDFANFKPGEILVTPMTTPDFIVIMKKAAGIVTDEGGLSCHAAIVSRELETPCVIGTKIATKVFKDSDLVEVDANKGIVRKL